MTDIDKHRSLNAFRSLGVAIGLGGSKDPASESSVKKALSSTPYVTTSMENVSSVGVSSSNNSGASHVAIRIPSPMSTASILPVNNEKGNIEYTSWMVHVSYYIIYVNIFVHS